MRIPARRWPKYEKTQCQPTGRAARWKNHHAFTAGAGWRGAVPAARGALVFFTMKNCQSCGYQIDDEARTCPKCGRVFSNTGGIAAAVVIGLLLGALVLTLLLMNRR